MERCRYCLQAHKSSECPDAEAGEFDDPVALEQFLEDFMS